MASSHSSVRIEELLQEDHNVKGKRERFRMQSTLLSKLTQHLGLHGNHAAAASWSDNGTGILVLKSLFLVVAKLVFPLIDT